MKTLILFLTLVQGLYFGSDINSPLSYPEIQSTNFAYSLSESDTSQQCKGIAKSTGERCKLRTKYKNGYCYLHQDQAKDNAIPESELSARQCLGQAKRPASDARIKPPTKTATAIYTRTSLRDMRGKNQKRIIPGDAMPLPKPAPSVKELPSQDRGIAGSIRGELERCEI